MSKNIVNTSLAEAIFSLSRVMKENMSYSSELTKLSIVQLQALIFLHKKQNAQMREIAEQFKIEMPTATSLMNKLCKMELVTRKEDAKDRRLVRIVLTQKGEELFEKAMKERTKKIDMVLSYLTEIDKKELLRITQLLVQRMEKHNEK